MLDPSKLSFAVPAFNNYKQYDRATAVVTISGTVPSATVATYTATVDLNRENATTSIQFATSVNSTYHSIGNEYLLNPDTFINHTDGSTPTAPGTAVYDIFFQNVFTTNQVTVTAAITNLDADTLTVVAEALTVTLYTFVTPFAL